MKPNNEAVRIFELVGDYRRVEAVLRDWGYSENVIQHLLAERHSGPQDFRATSDTSAPIIPLSSQNTDRLDSFPG